MRFYHLLHYGISSTTEGFHRLEQAEQVEYLWFRLQQAVIHQALCQGN